MSEPAAPWAPRSTALVHDWLNGMRGGEKVLEAIAELFPGAPIFTLLHRPGSLSPELAAHPIHPSFLQRAPGIQRWYRHYLPLFPAAIESLDLGAYPLVISSSHCVAKGVIPPPGSFHLCYCHTPMRYAWDQEAVYFPRRKGLVARLRGLALSSLRSWDVASASRVDLFVANSRFVAERIRRYYRRDALVLAPPVATEFYTPLEEGREPSRSYALVVAALAPYKRVDEAIAACVRLGLPLTIVGTGPEEARLRSGAGPSVRFLGRVPDAELRELYRHAACLLQPGVEDFGIAPVEALACGTPVVALGRGGVLDIVADGRHGVLYPGEGSVPALAAAIDKGRQIRFNANDLRAHAESFSKMSFLERFGRILEQHLPAAEGARAGRVSP